CCMTSFVAAATDSATSSRDDGLDEALRVQRAEALALGFQTGGPIRRRPTAAFRHDRSGGRREPSRLRSAARVRDHFRPPTPADHAGALTYRAERDLAGAARYRIPDLFRQTCRIARRTAHREIGAGTIRPLAAPIDRHGRRWAVESHSNGGARRADTCAR